MINIIAISGKSGCGNTTISNRIAKRFRYERINYTFRNLAEEHNMSFEQLLMDSKYNDKYDKELDVKQVEMARKGNRILASRLAIWLMKDEAITIYLNAS
jgi:CMP/dCMP kinase